MVASSHMALVAFSKENKVSIVINGAAGRLGTAIGRALNRVMPDVGIYGIDPVMPKDDQQVKYQGFSHQSGASWSNPGNLGAGVVINCAGFSLYKLSTEFTIQDFNRVYQSTVWGAIQVATELYDDLVENKGLLINITNESEGRPLLRCSAQAALEAATLSLAEEWRDEVSVICIKTGPRTDPQELAAFITAVVTGEVSQYQLHGNIVQFGC